MFRWLSLTLVLLAGCYADHGLDGRADAGSRDAEARPDAAPVFDGGAPIDAGMCRALPSNVSELHCPSVVEPGAPVSVRLQHGASVCCGTDAARLTASTTGERTITLSPSWDSCGCCELCACVGPVVEQPIDVGPLTEGVWTVVGDAARGITCTIEVRALAWAIHPVEAAIVPAASPLDEELPVSMRAAGLSCGCTPRGWYNRPREGLTQVGVERCECSDEDPCVDSGYEATALIPVPPFVGSFTASSDAGLVTSQIVDATSCMPGPRVISVEPLGIDPTLRHDAPIHVFARVTYEEAFCCARPLPLARELEGDPDRRAFALHDCTNVDCFCKPGPPQRLEDIVYLGVFPPGPSEIRVGDVDVRFEVPSS